MHGDVVEGGIWSIWSLLHQRMIWLWSADRLLFTPAPNPLISYLVSIPFPAAAQLISRLATGHSWLMLTGEEGQVAPFHTSLHWQSKRFYIDIQNIFTLIFKTFLRSYSKNFTLIFKTFLRWYSKHFYADIQKKLRWYSKQFGFLGFNFSVLWLSKIFDIWYVWPSL